MTAQSAQIVVDDEQLMTQKEAAEFLKVTPRTLEKWRYQGGGPEYYRYSARCVRYAQSDLKRWIDERKRKSTSEQ
ncbi:MAG: helix-turn-helix domain-containing protein [Rhodospirillaceae bacterium]